MPEKLFGARIDAAAWLTLARHPVLLRVVSVTAIHASAQFVLFSYLVIAYQEALHASSHAVAFLLGVMGLAGFPGNVVAGPIADRVGPPTLIFYAMCLMLVAFVVWVGLFAIGPGHWACRSRCSPRCSGAAATSPRTACSRCGW